MAAIAACDAARFAVPAQPISQTFGDGITHTNCTAVAATKQCGSLPAMNTSYDVAA